MNIFITKLKISDNTRKAQRGFTLIEMVVSLSLFISVMTVAASSMLSIIDANRKAQATNTAVGNLNFVIEDMARSLRTGKSWAVTKIDSANTKVSFVPQGKLDEYITSFYVQSGQVMTQVGSGVPEPLTDPNLVVDGLKFYLDTGTAVQPFLHVMLRAHVSDKAKYRSNVNISTTISQRTLNR